MNSFDPISNVFWCIDPLEIFFVSNETISTKFPSSRTGHKLLFLLWIYYIKLFSRLSLILCKHVKGVFGNSTSRWFIEEAPSGQSLSCLENVSLTFPKIHRHKPIIKSYNSIKQRESEVGFLAKWRVLKTIEEIIIGWRSACDAFMMSLIVEKREKLSKKSHDYS